MKLSVIIPAYNVEDTLRPCVESVLTQRVDGMEIIIVDDGSTDSTPALADALATENSAVTVVHQPNGGLSAARNSGLARAHGEIITFVDSDDHLAADSYAPLLALMDSSPCDILEYSFTRADGTAHGTATTFADTTYATLGDYWLAGRGYEHAYAWNKLFRRAIFFPPTGQGARFTEGILFEDTDFFVSLLRLPLTLTTTAHNGYIYTINPHGLSATADATASAHLLSAHLRAFNLLAICPPAATTRHCLRRDEEEYYLSVVNIQITLCRKTPCAPLLPTCRIALHMRDILTPVRMIKKLILILGGIRGLCRLFARL